MILRRVYSWAGARRGRAILARATLLAIASSVATGCGIGDEPKPLVSLSKIPSPAPPGSVEQNLFAAAGGRVLMSWIQPVEQPGGMDTAGSGQNEASPNDTLTKSAARPPQWYAMRFAVLRLGKPTQADPSQSSSRWSQPRTIVTSTHLFRNWADIPSIIELPDGSLAAHWLNDQGSGPKGYHYAVNVARSTDGGRTWSEAVVPHRDTSRTDHGFVSLFPLQNGRLGVVWLDGREKGDSNPEMQLRFTTISATGERGPDKLLDGRACTCCPTDAARTAQGPIVVYRNRSKEEVRDIYSIRYVDGDWTEPKPVHKDGWVIDGCPVNGPAVAAAGQQVAVAWFTAADEVPRVRLAFSSDAGASFAPPVRVDEGSPLGRVDVVLLPDGSALVSWLERTQDGTAQIRVRRVEPALSSADRPTAGPSVMVTSSTSAARASGFPSMVRSGDHVIFAWSVPGKPSTVQVAVAEIR